jgi:hypothetical protein
MPDDKAQSIPSDDRNMIHEIDFPKGKLLLYQSNDGKVRLETRLQNDTVWLTINQMSELFGVDKSGISRHIRNIYQTGELVKKATVAKFATVQSNRVCDRKGITGQWQKNEINSDLIESWYCVNGL